MSQKQLKPRQLVHSLDEIPQFTSDEDERDWWATHDLAPELGKDVTAEQHALIRRLKTKHRYVPVAKRARAA